MNKLLSMELKRAAKSPILWLGVIAVIAINVYGILLNGYGFKIFTTTFLLENSDLICIILAVLIPLYLGSDFENRTINNKISACCDCFCVHHHSICFVHYDCNDFT